MRNPLMLLLAMLMVTPAVTYAQSEENNYSREQGYFIRPELYGAVLAEFGYQINPHIQFSLGGGVEIAEQMSVPELVVGVRGYASETKWTAFFDYHLGLLLVGQYSIPDHRFTAGASYKNFDFGGGIMYVNVDGVGAWGPCVNIGYNIRFPKKQ